MVEIDESTPVYAIGVVKEMTDLTRRQIRYYEEVDLIKPARTEGNQRIYSQQDIEQLKEIKKLLEQGLNIAGIKKQLGTVSEKEIDKQETARLNLRGKQQLSSLYPVSNRADLVKLLSQEADDEE
ncbi:MAG: MerR family transcriptional regulator [Bacillota bacterium]